MGNLAVTLGDMGKLEQAAALEKEVLEKMQRILGHEHPDTISAMNNFAITLGDMGKLDEAAAMFQEVLEKRQRILGDEHPATDQAVWTIRDKVRETESARTSEHKPEPNYRHLHDLARHAIHVSETLALAVMAAGSISQQHLEIMGGAADTDEHSRRAAKRIGNRIVFYEHMLRALQCRAASNKERLMNEISLAFNTVAQYDSGISVNIGRAAQVDSAAMKTVAFLTLTFLPATFICAIFSMSFFNYDPAADSWTVSRKFWIYWAVAIPTTFVTALLWHYWRTVFPPTLIGEASEIDQKAHAIREKETSNHHGSSLLEDLA
ncbi:hypothetical protein GE09DRAFT_1217349 [Coniochaeta sp. 2T2.1]|nr:hypothetical protein GE09DRAFT_1217349 [Coniochaeta sp. 2T2.1]